MRNLPRPSSHAIVIAFALLVAAALIAAVLRAPSDAPAQRAEMSSETVGVGDAPQGLAFDGSRIWVGNAGESTVTAVDAGTLEVGPTVDTRRRPGGLAALPGSVWVGLLESDRLARIDPDAGEIAGRTQVADTPVAVVAEGGDVWVAGIDDGRVMRIDATSGEVEAEVELADAFPSALALTGDSVWVSDVVTNEVIRLDRDDLSEESRVTVGNSPTALAAGEGALWVANFNDRTVSRIDLATNEPTGEPIIVGGRPSGLAVGLGYVWVSRGPLDDDSATPSPSNEPGAVIRIDPESNEWTGEVFPVGRDPQGILVAAGAVWVANQADDTLSRLTLEE